MNDTHYRLPAAYVSRAVPEYCDLSLVDEKLGWQRAVYDLAEDLGAKLKASRFLDLGCGVGEKTATLASPCIGYDNGPNLFRCIDRFGVSPRRRWKSWDMENEPFPIGDLVMAKGAVVICADVIEHLQSPNHLLHALAELSTLASAVVVSTPDRARVYEEEQMGPPGNPCHVREWNASEFATLLKDYGFALSNTMWLPDRLGSELRSCVRAVALSADDEGH